MYIRINNNREPEVYIEKDDICQTCSNARDCPLITALNSEVAILRYESIVIENCGVYRIEKAYLGNKKMRKNY